MKKLFYFLLLLFVLFAASSLISYFIKPRDNALIHSKSYNGDYPNNPVYKDLLIKNMNRTKPPLVFGTKVIAAVRHNALDTRTKYFNLNSYDSIDDCIEVFTIFTDRNGINCYLGYKYTTQYYLIEISGLEQRQITQKLLDDGFYELTNLITRVELDDRRYGYYHPNLKNTIEDYSLIDYIGVFDISVGAINNGSTSDNAMIEGFFNYLKTNYLAKIVKEENKVENWAPRLPAGAYLE